MVAMLRRRHVVLDVHEDLVAQIESKEWISPALRPIFRWLAKALFGAAERFLILTLAEASYMTLFKKNHAVFANYPRYEGWPPPTTKGDGSAIYVGDTQTARGLDDAIDACGIARVPLTVIGPVDEAAKRRWRQKAAASGLPLTVTGRKPNPESIKRVGEASVGLSPLRDVPNYRNSLPTKTLEYLAMGVPVVATDLPGTREVLEAMDAVELVPPGDIDEMAEGIRNLVSGEAREAAYRQSEQVRAGYAWPSTEVLTFYTSLVSR
jgi:glycosyltransferase involved in cell wall biosynthesis